MGNFLIIGGIIAVVAIIIILLYHEKKRTEALKAIADSLNFSFSKEGDNSLLAPLKPFHLFSQGYAKRASNVMKGRANDIDVTIMDYQYTVGGGRSSQTLTQMVIVFQSSLLRLPCLTLQPEGLLHKIASAFGYQDIDFDSHPTFSKQYLLQGTDEEALRNIFTYELLAYYDQLKGLSTEGDGDKLIFYRAGNRVPPQDIRSFLEEGFGIFSLVKKRRHEGTY